MISLGKAIRQPNDPLIKIELRVLAAKIKRPKPDFVNLIQQLRNVKNLDAAKYRQMKTQLPYVVAAVFNPPFRKIQNFAHTAYFILDIDHLSDKEIDIDLLFDKLAKNPFVVLMFRSPSNDGLKLFFRFGQKCFDAGMFTLFYKIFAHKFAADYQLAQVVDKSTSDVSRACFASYDPNAYYNPDAQNIKMDTYVDFDNQVQIMETEKMLKQEAKEADNKPDKETKVLPNDIWRDIREKLNPKIKEKREKQIFVPEKLETIIDDVKSKINFAGIEVKDIQNIHYGKKICVEAKHHWAEVNIFYGRKGFSVVGTPKSGSNSELMDITRQLICELLL